VRGHVIKWEPHREDPSSFKGLVEDRSGVWFGFKTFEVVQAGYLNAHVFVGDLLEFDEGPTRTGAKGRQVRTATNIRICTKR
jgi:hypothetical protein